MNIEENSTNPEDISGIPKGALRCFLDGDCLLIVKDDFVNLQESDDYLFLKLTTLQLAEIAVLEKANMKDSKWGSGKVRVVKVREFKGDFHD